MNQRIQLLFGILVFTLSLHTGLGAQPALLVDTNTEEQLLYPHLSALEDPSGSLTLTTARAALRAGQGQSNFSGNPAFGATAATVWLRFVISDSRRNAGERLLHLGIPRMQSIVLYHPDGRVDRSGIMIEPHERPFQHAEIVFPLRPGQNSEYIMKVNTQTSMLQLPLVLYSPRAFALQLKNRLVINALYIGLSVGLFLYNFCLFLILRNRVILLYIVFLTSYLFLQMDIRGFAVEYIWSSSSLWNALSGPLLVHFTFMSMLLFARGYLKIDRKWPVWNVIFLGMIGLQLIFFLLATFQAFLGLIPFFLRFIAPTVLFVPTLILIAGIVRLIRGYRPAFFFVLAWVSLLVGMVIVGLEVAGLIPFAPWARDGILMGSALEMVLLSIGLAHRFREFELEHERDRSISRARSDFLRTMSHDMRTPLATVVGIGDILAGTKLDQRQSEYVKILQNAGEHLLFIVNDLLDLSRIEAGQIKMERTPFDLSAALKEVAGQMQVQAAAKGLELKVDTSEMEGLLVMGDPGRLRQILLNLIGNAIKFTAKGRVDVSATQTPRSAGEQDIRVEFRIKDTGPGIPAHFREKIFEPFHQMKDTPSVKGAGLGLAISQRFAQLMNGEIRVADEPGPGSTFLCSVSFGAVTDLGALSEEEHIPGGSRRQLSIMVVEDDVELQKIIEAFFQGIPHQFEILENGQSALDKFKSGSYDLVLIDRQLPVLDGLAAVRGMRQWEKQARSSSSGLTPVPIFALSADGGQRAVEESLAAGCDGHLTKPIRKQELLDFVSKIAEKSPDRT